MAISVVAEPVVDGTGVRAGVTITGLGVGDSTITLWRSYDAGEREAVSGYRRVLANDATFIRDHHVPVGRPVTYELEVISGPAGVQRAYAAPITVDTGGQGILSDPLVPASWVPLVGDRNEKTDIYLRGAALQELTYKTQVSTFELMGARKPMALFGQRMAESGVDTSVATRTFAENVRLNKLLRETSYLLFRPHPDWGVDLPGAMFLINPEFKKVNVDTFKGGNLTWFNLVSDSVAAPAIKVLTGTFTWGDVAIMFNTWGQKRDAVRAGAAASGQNPTWLYDLKNPLG